ncbi:hypothetical protein BD410DRAFT_325099 [Rickenella mellea]|uniref:DUF6535 domain-containing protein n=1 Tax=Rickenella mellea TaxID=50990 RepID=A0A4Y7QJ87_9AGAM|nr:hypothetical protein BD410DRAFT_325099 [Rickenella mellea]
MPDTEEKGDNIRGTSNNPDIYDEPSDKMWSIYVSEAEKFDKALVESWKGDMEGLLIFAGLFSASVTAFIIESYKKLSPDSGDAMVVLLAQISSQLVAISNGTNLSITSPPPAKTSFRPTSSAVTVNILWFLSLSLGLLCALGATMVQQWARNYAQLIERRPAPNKRARIRAYLYEGIETFRVKAVVDVIPTLLHLSLFLFFTGLVVFLLPIDLRVALPMIIVLIIGVILYTTITFLPMVYKNCPYRTPLTPTLWNIMQGLSLLRYRTASGNVIRIRGKMVEGQEQLATEAIPERNERDTAALRWTLKSLADDNGLERFIDAIPAFLRSSGGTPFEVLENLMLEGLCNRTRRLFVGCHERAGLDGTLRRRRAILCMSTLRAMVTNSMKSSLGWLPSAWGDTLEALRKDNDSTVAVLAICTTATAAFHLLSFIAQDIPSKFEVAGEHAADEQFLEKMFSLIPIDELAASMVMGGGISTQLSAELIGDTLHILRNQDVLDATNRYLINCARYRTEIAKYRLQVIFDFFQFQQSLPWSFA